MKYLGGVALYHEQSEGFLFVNEKALEFTAKKFSFNVPIEQIMDVKTKETDDAAKAVGSYLALGMLGLAATRSMSKIRVMTVVFKNSAGLLQKAQFRFLPRFNKEVKFMGEAAAKLTGMRRNLAETQKKNELPSVQESIPESTVEMTKQSENDSKKEVIVKVRCLKCRQLFDETFPFCPYCGTPNK